MKKIALIVFTLCSIKAPAQTDSSKAMEDIYAFQKKLDDQYRKRDKSPLEPKEFRKFKGHKFFPINLAYRANAKLTVTAGTPFFGMKTTTSRLATERVYGYVEFTLAGRAFRLPVYQSQDLIKTEEYADYLFFPFTDFTNGKESYSGGRYIDLRIPAEGDSLVIDFNKAYNPYCAYSARYSCPIVPPENRMDVEIPAGVMFRKKK